MTKRVIVQKGSSREGVAHIYTNTNQDGNGVFVGNTLFTAAHVVAHSENFRVFGKSHTTRSAICYLDDDYWYKKVLRILSFNLFGWHFDDFTLYEANSHSFLILSSSLPLVNDVLETYSIKDEIKKQENDQCHIIFSTINKSHLVIHVDSAKVLYIRGNYIFCEMNEMLENGRSGCPLIKGNKVYGILRGGDDKRICWFQSSVSILKRLQEHNIRVNND